MSVFDIEYIAFEISDYGVSYVELIATSFGLISVYLASRANIFTWVTGIVNEFFLFILFFQIQLYPDMLLQVYFFIVTLYGWYFWKQEKRTNKISKISLKSRLFLTALILVATLCSGALFSNIHQYLPEFFPLPATYPWTDSFIMVSSIVATALLAKKKIETWILWITIDLVCVILYFKKDVHVLALEYLIFLGLASYGMYNWRKSANYG